jgi:hypothetical protein
VADLLHEQGTRVDLLARQKGAGVEAEVVEEVDRDAACSREVEEPGVEVHLAEDIERVHILDGHRALGRDRTRG